METEVQQLLNRLATQPETPPTDWVQAYDSANEAKRTQLLNGLAALAGDNSAALEALLTLVDARRLAVPAIRRVVLNQDDVNDVQQDVLIQVAHSVAGFGQQARFTTWLHALARNVAVAHLRRQRPTSPLPSAQAGESALSHRISSMVASRADVRAAVAALPDPYALTVRLRDIDQLSYQDIAEREGININTVKSRLARGRAMLVRHIGPIDGSDLGQN